MLIKVEPVALAIESRAVSANKGGGACFIITQFEDGHLETRPADWERPSSTAIVFTEPSGIPFTQSHARELASFEQIIFVCGHYEGIDHRAEEAYATHVFSIGDYVLTNGELPALVMADAVTRLLPGVLGAAESLEEDSFSGQGLSAPNYTKPPVWRGREVPEVLRSGDHKRIEEWRRIEGEKRTRERRPDLLP